MTRNILKSLTVSILALPFLQGCLSSTSSISMDVAGPGGSGSSSSSSEQPPTTQIALANNVVISSQCGQQANNHIVFSPTSSHSFLGYGAALQPPSNSTAEAQAVADLKGLNFQWIKTDFGNPYKGKNGLDAPVGVSDSVMYNTITANVKSAFSQVNLAFINDLHSNGIKIVNAMYGAPKTYVISSTNTDGSLSTKINPANIGDFSQFYVATFHSMNDLGYIPDLAELQNEPNGDWDVKWTPTQFATFVQGINTSLGNNPGVTGNITSAGTSTMVQNAVDFATAIQSLGELSTLKALTMHNYYVIQAPNNGGIPPADDPALQQLVSLAQAAGGIPVISTEFGGTDLKTKNTDPNLESVNPAEEMKVALDLIRQGESAAVVWNLYPNNNGGQLLKTWALIDENGPTNAYWPFKALSPNIPANSSVLKVQSTDISPTMTSPGYVAFKSGNQLVIALANPGSTNLTFSVDVASTNYVINSVHSFDQAQLYEQVTNLPKKGCPLTITLPGDTAANDQGKGVVLNMTVSQ